MTSPRSNDAIDQLLRSYFRREMPARMPAAPHGERATLPMNSATTLSAGRLLVGVSLAAIVALYIGVSAFFPREQSSGLNPNAQPIIGQLPKIVTPQAQPSTP